jgi:hypothetical protein
LLKKSQFKVKKCDLWTDVLPPDFDQRVLRRIDMALNEWVDSVPEHCRSPEVMFREHLFTSLSVKWDPHRVDPLFFNQSAMQYTTYFYFQILVHRPFITASHINSEVAKNALSICANAARSAIHVMEVQCRRNTGHICLPNVTVSGSAPSLPPLSDGLSSKMSLFNAAVVLLLNLWGDRQLGLSTNPGRDLTDVYTVISIFHLYEKRWQFAGRYA